MQNRRCAQTAVQSESTAVRSALVAHTGAVVPRQSVNTVTKLGTKESPRNLAPAAALQPLSALSPVWTQ